eukprot:scaffold123027_cov63-Phaeocystis_antarctica.AAC.1
MGALDVVLPTLEWMGRLLCHNSVARTLATHECGFSRSRRGSARTPHTPHTPRRAVRCARCGGPDTPRAGAAGADKILTLDFRYREIPEFHETLDATLGRPRNGGPGQGIMYTAWAYGFMAKALQRRDARPC